MVMKRKAKSKLYGGSCSQLHQRHRTSLAHGSVAAIAANQLNPFIAKRRKHCANICMFFAFFCVFFVCFTRFQYFLSLFCYLLCVVLHARSMITDITKDLKRVYNYVIHYIIGVRRTSNDFTRSSIEPRKYSIIMMRMCSGFMRSLLFMGCSPPVLRVFLLLFSTNFKYARCVSLFLLCTTLIFILFQPKLVIYTLVFASCVFLPSHFFRCQKFFFDDVMSPQRALWTL